MSVTFTSRFDELYDEDKVCIINLINTMASFKGIINFKDGIKKMKKELIEEWRVSTADEDEEDEEEWDDVYAICPIQDFTSDEVFKPFHNKKNTFYQIGGGGPISGWIADDNNVWYAIKDSYCTKWKYELTEYKRVEVREEDVKNGITKAVRVL
jgi:hypothetical protein